jgi:hypothetical protein
MKPDADRGWLAKWRERKRRRNERLAERIAKRPHKLGDEQSLDQAAHAVRSIPTSSGGMIG